MFVTSKILNSLAQKGILSIVQHDPELVPQAKGIVQWVQHKGGGKGTNQARMNTLRLS